MGKITLKDVIKDVEDLKKQNKFYFENFKEVNRLINNIETEIKNVRNLNNTINYKIQSDYEKLKRIILDENISITLKEEIKNNLKYTNEKLSKKLDNAEFENYKNNNENDKKSINEQLDNIENNKTDKSTTQVLQSQVDTIAYIDVTKFTGANDNEMLINAFNYIISLDSKIKKLTTSKVLNLTTPITLDFRGGKGYEVDLQISPLVTGSALTLTNAIGLKAKLDVIGGGNDINTNNAFEIHNLHHCKLEVFGSYFKGTLLRVTGKELDFSRCLGMEIKIRNYNCNRTLYHGDDVYPGSGFGCYTDVWEETWDASNPEGSVITGVHDVSCNHWESHFLTEKVNEVNLSLVGLKSCYFGYLALGGKCSTLLNVGYESDVTIDSLHLGSENRHNVNGVKLGTRAELYCRFLKLVGVGDGVIIPTTDSIAVFDVIKCDTNVNRVIYYNNRDLGYSNTKKISFSTLKTLPLARNIIVTKSPTLNFVNGEATYTLNRNDNNITYISGAFVMPFGSANVFGIGITNEDTSSTTFKIRCATDSTFSTNLQCRLIFLCENQL